MKKIILFLFVLLFALAAVHSDMLQTNTAFKAVLSVDAQNQFTNQPVTGFQARGYICGDHSCSFVTDALWSNQPKHTHTHQLVLDYPTNPPLYGDFSYGVFYYKEGYVPYEVTLAPQGSGHGMTTVYLSKIDMCRSPIDTFSVTNTVYPNQPVMVDIVTALDSKAHAAIKNAGPIEYIPDELQSHYSVQTKIILDILDSTGAVVDQQEKVVSIPYSEYEHIQFEWIPEQVGAYSARVRTQVPDAKCLDYQEHSSSKQFSVINEGSTNMCYALAQDLYASPVEPEVGQTVTAYVDALANFYNEFGELKTTPFSVEFTVKKDGAVVHSEVKNIAQHSQDDQFIRTQTSFIPTQKGYYSISARAVVDTCPYDANLDDTVSQTIYVKGEKTVDPDPDPNAPPIVSALPKKTLLNNQSQYPNAIILDNYVFDPDGDELTYTITSQTNSQLVDCTLADTQLGKVDCHLPNILSQQWFLMPPEYEQTFENFLNKHAVSFEEGDEKWYYIHGKKDPQVWFYSFKKDEWIDIAYDVFFKGAWIYKKNTSIYHLQSGTLALSSVTTGSSTVGFEVTDGTDAVSFTWDIDVLDANRPPVFEDISDIFLRGDITHHANILNLNNYASDPDGDALTFGIAHQSNRDLVECSLFGSYLSCEVKENKDGQSQVVFTASDGSKAATQTVTIFVEQVDVNRPPVFSSIPGRVLYNNHSLYENIIRISDFVTDPDGDELKITLESQSRNDLVSCSLDSQTRLSCSVSQGKTGVTILYFRATDGKLSATASMRIHLEQGYVPFTFDPIEDFTLDGSVAEHRIISDILSYVSDRDRRYEFSLTQSNTDLVDCEQFGGRFTCFVQKDEDGQSQLSISIDDGTTKLERTFTVFVQKSYTPFHFSKLNDATLAGNIERHVVYNDLRDFIEFGSRETISFSVVLQSNSNLVHCFIEQFSLVCDVNRNEDGSSTLSIRADDGKTQQTQSMTVFVEKVIENRPPVTNYPDINIKVGDKRVVYDLKNFAVDPDSDPLTFSVADGDTSIATCRVASNSHLLCEGVSVGQTQITITTSDGIHTVEDLVTVTVSEKPQDYVPFTFNKLNDATLAGNIERHIVYDDLRDFIEFGSKETVSFSVVLQSNSNLVHCFVEQFSLICDVNRNEDGSSTLSIRADDGKTQQTQSMTVFVEKVIENRPPVTNYPDINIKVGDKRVVYDLKNFAVDPDSDPLTFSVADGDTSIATCRVASSSHLLCEGVSVGQTQITITTSDGIHTVEDLVTVTVSEKPQDYVPFTFNKLNDATLAGNIERHVVYNDLRDFIEFGSKETVSFSVVLQSNSNLVHCFIEQFSLVCDVNRNEDGSSTLSIRADDGKTQQPRIMTVFVEEVIENRPPVTNYPDVFLMVGEQKVAYSLDDHAFDPDEDVLQFSVQNTDTSIAQCRVVSRHLVCSGESSGQTSVIITTTDGQEVVTDTVQVTVVSGLKASYDSVTIPRNAKDYVALDLLTGVSEFEGSVSFEIVSQSNPQLISCRVGEQTLLVCSAATNREGFSDVVVQIRDDHSIVQETIRVMIEPYQVDRGEYTDFEPRSLRITNIDVPDIDQRFESDIRTTVSVTNNLNRRLDFVSITASIPELGTRSSRVLINQLQAGQTQSRQVTIPLYGAVQPGWYTVQYSVHASDGSSRVVYREVRAE